MIDLVEAFESDKACIKWDVHGKVYNKVLSRFADQKIRFLEIGIWMGASMKIWNRCFPDATLFGMDKMLPVGVDLRFIEKVYIGDQSYPEFMQRVADDIGELDVCIDDGGHFADEQQVTFEKLWPIIKSGGVYVIEDLHCANERVIEPFKCTIDFLESLDGRKEFYPGVNEFEKDICVLYKE